MENIGLSASVAGSSIGSVQPELAVNGDKVFINKAIIMYAFDHIRTVKAKESK